MTGGAASADRPYSRARDAMSSSGRRRSYRGDSVTFWWMQPGWKDTLCACGANIWQTGGDPDWGECYDCFSRRHGPSQCAPPAPMCDICGEHEACAGANGYAVCSQECMDKALAKKEEHAPRE